MLLEPIKNQIIDCYNYGLSTIKVASIFGCSAEGVYKLLHRNDIKIRGREEYGHVHRKIFFDQTFFDIIDTEAKAYFLGFLYADGTVRTNKWEIQLVLHYRDYEILNKFAKLINYPISKIRCVDMKDHKELMVKIALSSKHMVKSLIKHGCVPNKTFKLIFPTTVPDELLNHFCRGYFDGDGSIFKLGNKTHWRIQVLSTFNFLFEYGKKVEQLCGSKYSNIYKHVNIYRLLYLRKSDVFNVGKWLYEDATIYLNRKHDKFIEMINRTDWNTR